MIENGNCDIIYQLGTAKFGARNDDATLNEEKLRKKEERKQWQEDRAERRRDRDEKEEIV